MMVDAAYDDLYRAMKPGLRENEAVGPGQQGSVRSGLGICRSGECDFRRALQSASACVFRSRAAPGRSGVLRHSAFLHGLPHLLLPLLHDRLRFARDGGCLQALPRISGRRDRLVRPGRTTAEIAAVWPKAQEFGFPDEEAAFALQFGHGIGLAIWEKPVISRLVSLEHSHEIKPGMVFALETFWPSTDGWSAARIEEEIVVTETGHEVITRFPAENSGRGRALLYGERPACDDARKRSAAEPARAWKWWKPAPKRRKESGRRTKDGPPAAKNLWPSAL